MPTVKQWIYRILAPILVISLIVFVYPRLTYAAVTEDVNISADQVVNSGSVTTGTFSTASTNELILAFCTSDGVGSVSPTITASGATLTWVLVKRTNTQLGSAEIWRAFSAATLSSKTVTCTSSNATDDMMITVKTFSGVDTTGSNGSGAIGATGTGSGSGDPTVTIATTRNNSWVLGDGENPFFGTTYTAGASQTVIHSLNDVNDISGAWSMKQNATTPTSGTNVTLNITNASGQVWNMSTVEVLPPANVVVINHAQVYINKSATYINKSKMYVN